MKKTVRDVEVKGKKVIVKSQTIQELRRHFRLSGIYLRMGLR